MDSFELLPGEVDKPAALISKSLLLTAIRGGNAYEETVERLLQTIRLGLVHSGDQLPPERELASMLNVSRDSVRDATGSLAEAGYLVIRRGRYGGTFIADEIPSGLVEIGRDGGLLTRQAFTKTEIEDVLIYREALETGAARAAAQAEMSGEARDGLWQLHLDCKGATVEEYRRYDSRLHLYIAELSGSNTLLNQVAQSRMKTNEFLNQFPLLQPNLAHSSEQHEQIVMAILTGKPDQAQDAMRVHVEGSASLIRGFLG